MASGFDFYYSFKITGDAPTFIQRVSKNLGLPNAGPVVVFPENAMLVASRYLKLPRRSHSEQRAFFRSAEVLNLFKPGDQVAFPYSKAALQALIKTNQELVQMTRTDLLVRIKRQSQNLQSIQQTFFVFDMVSVLLTCFVGLGFGVYGHAKTGGQLVNSAKLPAIVKQNIPLRVLQAAMSNSMKKVPIEVQKIYYNLIKLIINPAIKGGKTAVGSSQISTAAKTIKTVEKWAKSRSTSGAVARNTIGWLSPSRWTTLLHQTFWGESWDWDQFKHGPDVVTKRTVLKMIRRQRQQEQRFKKIIASAQAQMKASFYRHRLSP